MGKFVKKLRVIKIRYIDNFIALRKELIYITLDKCNPFVTSINRFDKFSFS